MYLRLAFATAIHTNPDIMLIDEAFAVGDQSFQKKCMSKMKEFKSNGKTIIFVSHALESVKSICSKALLLDHGTNILIDETPKVIDRYLQLLNDK